MRSGDCLRVEILLGGISLFLLVCSSSWFIFLLCHVNECKCNLLFPQQRTRGVFMTDTAKKAFQEGEEEEEVKTKTFIMTKYLCQYHRGISAVDFCYRQQGEM